MARHPVGRRSCVTSTFLIRQWLRTHGYEVQLPQLVQVQTFRLKVRLCFIHMYMYDRAWEGRRRELYVLLAGQL